MESIFLTPEQALRKAEREAVERERLERVDRLVAQFDGAIKYLPLLTDHPELIDEDCLAFARKWHAVAVERLKVGIRGWDAAHPERLWNHGIPYCRNDHEKVPR